MTTVVCRCKFLQWGALTLKVYQLVNLILQFLLESLDDLTGFNRANSNNKCLFSKKCKLKQ